MDDKLTAKTVKIMSLENLYVYGILPGFICPIPSLVVTCKVFV